VISSHDVFLEGAHDVSRRLVEGVLVEHGFTLSLAPDGSTRAVRGTLARTLAFRAFAGRDQLLTLSVQWFVDDRRRLVARVVHDPSSSVLGGPVGLVRAQRAVLELTRALDDAAARACPPKHGRDRPSL